MPREERRAAIVEATMPLLEEHGLQLTTKQVADAAGVAEGTIFRAFESLQDVLDATIRESLSSGRLTRLLDQQEFPGDLEGDTAAAVEAIGRHYEAIKTMVHLAHTSPTEARNCAREEFFERYRELLAFLEARFTTHADELTIGPREFAQLLLVVTGGQHTHARLGVTSLPNDALVYLALHGARKEPR